MTGHSQITQNNKSSISLQHVNKEVSDAVDFLNTNTHKACYKLILRKMIDTNLNWFDSDGQAFTKFPK